MMRLSWKPVLVAACGLATFGGALSLNLLPAANAQPASSGEAHTIYLWDGTGATDANVSLHSWGNGSAKPKKAVDYTSRSALVVTTHNLYEGARFVFAQPLDLTPYRSGFLRLRLRSQRQTDLVTPSTNQYGAPGSTGGYPSTGGYNPSTGGYPSLGGPGATSGGYNPYPGATSGGYNPNPGAATGGYNPYPGAATGGYNPYPTTAPTATPDPTANVPAISKIQVVLRLDNGAMFGQIDFSQSSEDTTRPDSMGWQVFTVPIQSLRVTPGASGALRSVILTGDSDRTFMAGQIALVPAGTLSVSIRRAVDAPGTQQTEVTVAPGVRLKLVADVESGEVDPNVEWNFDADKTGSLPPAKTEQPLSGTFGGRGGRGGRGGMGGPYGSAMYGSTAPGVPGAAAPESPPSPGGANPYVSPDLGGIRDSSGRVPSAIPGAPSGSPSEAAGVAPITPNGPRLDARGLATSFTFPNEEQDYRVEVTVRDRQSSRELGKASLIVHVRSAS